MRKYLTIGETAKRLNLEVDTVRKLERTVAEDDRAFATRLARYCARNPVALERLTYDRTAKAVTYRSDKSEGPTAGTGPPTRWSFLPACWSTSPTRGTSPRGTTAGMRAARAACAVRGGAPAADLRGRPPRVPDVPRAHADHRVHHPAVGDRPDPHAPLPRHHRRARRGAESPIDPGACGVRGGPGAAISEGAA